MKKKQIIALTLTYFFVVLSGCSNNSDNGQDASFKDHSLEVLATGYTSSPSETTKEGGPFLAAWGDTLEPGMKAIAVSRDLIPMGLGHRTKVKIQGLEGEYEVLDKMNKRWTNKIDIYFGLDKKAAKEWGKRTVEITWRTPLKE